jgi:drug/metabolite transporter (DMT)-like permease
VRADIIAGMDEPPELQQISHWRRAVWALRVGFLGLAVVIVGVVLVTTGSTPWVLATGVLVWLSAAVVTVTGVVSARRELPEPRPGLWPLRFMLLHDTVHARPST